MHSKIFSFWGTLITAGILFAFLLPRPSYAATTYYVSTTGTDTNTTTQAQNPSTPWLTLNHAESTASTGDTVNVAAGTYVENDPATHGWNTAKGISWMANGTVIVQASSGSIRVLMTSGNTVASFNGFTFDAQNNYSTALYLQANVANKTFSNCTFKNATASLISTAGTATNITVNGSTFFQDAGNAITSGSNTNFEGLQITNSTFTATSGNTLVRLAGTASSITWQNNTASISGNLSYGWNITSPANVTISGENDTVTASAAWFSEASTASGSISLKNNTITQSSAQQTIFIGTNSSWNTSIDSNTITSTNPTFNGNVIYVYNATPLSITHNTIDTTSPNVNALINVQSSGSTMNSVQVSNNTLRNRNANGNPQYSIIVGTDYPSAYNNLINGAEIIGNTIYGALYYNPNLSKIDTHGIIYGFNENGVIKNNTVYGQAYGVAIKGDGTTTYSSGGVFYNVLINNTGNSGIRVKGVNNLNIYNNTVDAELSTTSAYRAIYIGDDLAGQASTGTVVKNNIFVSNGDGVIAVDPDSQAGLVSDCNLFYRPTGTTIGISSANTYTFSQWQNLGYDKHSINANPLFTNPSFNDYSLQSSSPAIDAGTNVGLSSDIANTPVPQGAGVDMGAYEYKGNTANTPSANVYYTFEEGTGSATILNRVATTSAAVWGGMGSHYTNGQTRLGGNFNGIDDYASFDTTNTLTATSGSVSMWIDPGVQNTASGSAFAFTSVNPNSANTSRIYLQFYTNKGNQINCTLGNTTIGVMVLPANTWSYITCTWNGTAAAFYVNGISHTSTSTFSGLSNLATTATLGALHNYPTYVANYYTGGMDGVKIYNYALTQAQIQQDMTNP